MKFVKKLNDLLSEYLNSSKIVDNAVLYDICEVPPPLARHIVFSPAPNELVKRLIDDYKLIFPKELLKLFSSINGANLFWTTYFVGNTKRCIPISCLSIYGIPLTQDRKHIEPFNIRIEDLNRPKNAPGCWLKFASYYKPNSFAQRQDLFVDTYTGQVFSVVHESEKCVIIEAWESIDTALCDVLDLLGGQ